jgi:hypothetical protein
MRPHCSTFWQSVLAACCIAVWVGVCEGVAAWVGVCEAGRESQSDVPSPPPQLDRGKKSSSAARINEEENLFGFGVWIMGSPLHHLG